MPFDCITALNRPPGDTKGLSTPFVSPLVFQYFGKNGFPPSVDGKVEALQSDKLLHAALEIAYAAVPDLRKLASDLLPRMPRKPRASQNLRSDCLHHSTSPMLLDKAIDCPWVAFDSVTVRNALLIDIDHDDWFDARLAMPESIRPHMVQDPWSGRAHAIVMLSYPVSISGRAGLKPQQYADLAGRLVATALGGKLLPVGSLVKNPFGLARNLVGTRIKRGPEISDVANWEYIQANGLMWRTLEGASAVELKDIREALGEKWILECPPPSPMLKRWGGKKRGEPSQLGRNCALFDLVRWWCYDNCEKDLSVIQSRAESINSNFPIPLQLSEVSGVARSIARFMATTFNPRYGIARGRDRHLTAGLSLPQAQSISAHQTNKARRGKTDEKIRMGLREIHKKNMKLTQVSLAKASGVSLRTIKKRWHGLSFLDLEWQEKVQSGGLSGNGTLEGAGVFLQKGSFDYDLISYSSISGFKLADAAKVDRQFRSEQRSDEHQRVKYEVLKEKMQARCARVLAVFPPRPGAPESLHAVYRAAIAAQNDAKRRHGARKNADRRKATFLELARIARMSPELRQAAWKRHLEILRMYWDARIDDAPASKRDLLRDVANSVISRRCKAFTRVLATVGVGRAEHIPW